MEKLFLICGVVGGTALVFQFLTTLLGFGSHGIDSDHIGVGDGLSHGLDAHVDHAADHAPDHDSGSWNGKSTWLFGIVSFRTLVAALTFFGLCGYAALSAGQSAPVSLLIGLACGYAAMYGVHTLLRFMMQLTQDRTQRIERAVGVHGKVYVPVPGGHQGRGKVQLSVQDRIVEYAAVTSGPQTLHTGAAVVVTRIVDAATVEVELLTPSLAAANS
jgi:hypothetical protein